VGRALLLISIAAAACGSKSAQHDAAIDAPKLPDAAPDAHFGAQTVFAVDCSTVTPDAMVHTVDGVNTTYFPPQTTIAAGQVVQFMDSITHDVAAGHGSSDLGLAVDFDETKCLRFTVPGTYNFLCTTHAFYGQIVVQ
jgi:plastocyanin